MLNWNYTRDKFTLIKGVYYVMFFFILLIIAWGATQHPTTATESDVALRAIPYYILAILGFIGIMFDMVLSLRLGDMKNNMPTIAQVFNTSIAGEPIVKLSRGLKILIYSLAIIFVIVTFSWISTSQTAIVQAPQFQVVELGGFGDYLFTAIYAIVEDVIFFGILPGTIFGVVYVTLYYSSKSIRTIAPIIAFLLALFIAPAIFDIYHIYTYGFNDFQAMAAVYLFGFINTAWVLTMRNIFFCNALHIANNEAINFFNIVAVGFGIS